MECASADASGNGVSSASSARRGFVEGDATLRRAIEVRARARGGFLQQGLHGNLRVSAAKTPLYS